MATTVKALREAIARLPDDMPVLIDGWDNEPGMTDPNIGVVTVVSRDDMEDPYDYYPDRNGGTDGEPFQALFLTRMDNLL